MQKSGSWLFMAAIAVCGAACASDVDVVAEPRAHVDLAMVVEAGDVAPVDNLTSAGQPDVAALEVFAKSGYVAVIDMRGANENRGYDEPEAVESLGMQYIAFPISGSEAISFENAQQLDSLLSDLDGPVLLHCGSGNRVGALLALRSSLAGADDEVALEYGKSAGLTGLEPLVKERLAEK